MHRHLTYANVTATVALVFAMSGGALAAGHYVLSSPRQIGPHVLKSFATTNTRLFKKLSRTATVAKARTASSAGHATAAGHAATADSATSAGHALSADVATSANHAATADSAPLPATLLSGQTIRGDYYIEDSATVVGQYESDSLSFAIPLASAPSSHVIFAGDAPPAQCPGTLTDPQARPGNLCVYEGDHANRANLNVRDPTSPTSADGQANRFGAGIWTTAAGTGEMRSSGTWAVTAP